MSYDSHPTKRALIRSAFAAGVLGIILLSALWLAKPGAAVPQIELSRSFSYDARENKNFAQHALDALKHTFAGLRLPMVKPQRLRGEAEGRINVLLLGVAGPGHHAPDLTDTIAVFSFSPNAAQKKILLTIPRDLIVSIPESRLLTKINSLYAFGKKNATTRSWFFHSPSSKEAQSSDPFARDTELVRRAVERVTGLPVHYALVMNLAALRDAIDALGGIEVYVDHTIYDTQYPTEGFGITTFSLEQGWHTLDGTRAEKFARTRHDPQGDFGRVRRQIQIAKAVQRKATNLNIISDFPKVLSVYQALATNIKTDLELGEVRRVWEMTREINFDDITYFVLDSRSDDALLSGGLMPLGNNLASALWPKKGLLEYSEIQQKIAALVAANANQ